MAKQARLPGLDHLQIDGEYFSWNESFDEYWSDSGEPRVLQEGEIAAWRVQFNTLRTPRRARRSRRKSSPGSFARWKAATFTSWVLSTGAVASAEPCRLHS